MVGLAIAIGTASPHKAKPEADQEALLPTLGGLPAPACKSVVELAHHQKLRDAHKPEFLAALDKVLTTTKDAELVERATHHKAGKTWEKAVGGSLRYPQPVEQVRGCPLP